MFFFNIHNTSIPCMALTANRKTTIFLKEPESLWQCTVNKIPQITEIISPRFLVSTHLSYTKRNISYVQTSSLSADGTASKWYSGVSKGSIGHRDCLGHLTSSYQSNSIYQISMLKPKSNSNMTSKGRFNFQFPDFTFEPLCPLNLIYAITNKERHNTLHGFILHCRDMFKAWRWDVPVLVRLLSPAHWSFS